MVGWCYYGYRYGERCHHAPVDSDMASAHYSSPRDGTGGGEETVQREGRMLKEAGGQKRGVKMFKTLSSYTSVLMQTDTGPLRLLLTSQFKHNGTMLKTGLRVVKLLATHPHSTYKSILSLFRYWTANFVASCLLHKNVVLIQMFS